MKFTCRRPNPVFSVEYEALRQVVIAARKKAGLTQAQVACGLGKAKSHVSMIERGQRRIDALELYYLAKCFGADPSELFGEIASGLAGVRLSGPPL